MLRFVTTVQGKRVIGLGLSFANLAKLEQGKPIAVDFGELGFPGINVLICAGETEESLRGELVEHGFLPREVLDVGRVRPRKRQDKGPGGPTGGEARR